MPKAAEIQEALVNKIIDRLDHVDTEGWEAPWHFDASQAHLFRPLNASTRKPYQGGNVLVLWGTAVEQEYTTGWWATYKQWEALGAQVRKGEKGTGCVKWSSVIDRKTKGTDKERSTLIPLGFTLFNADQVDGWEIPEVPAGPDTIEHAEEFFAAIGATVLTDDHAYFSPAFDNIGIPALHTFKDSESYYAVLGHEHVHWTGAKARLDREQGGRFGSEDYAYEELVAELGAAFLCAHLGISNEPRDDHAQYLKFWLAKLKADPKLLWKAASAAQKAVNFLVEAAGDTAVPEAAGELVAA